MELKVGGGGGGGGSEGEGGQGFEEFDNFQALTTLTLARTESQRESELEAQLEIVSIDEASPLKAATLEGEAAAVAAASLGGGATNGTKGAKGRAKSIKGAKGAKTTTKAEVSSSTSSAPSSKPSAIKQFPPGVIGFGLDDSLGQRLMIEKIFMRCGVPDEDCHTYGVSPGDIEEFLPAVVEAIAGAKTSGGAVLVVVDEDLGYGVRSGSEIAADLLSMILVAHRPLLTLVMRSAADDLETMLRFATFADAMLNKGWGLPKTQDYLSTMYEQKTLGREGLRPVVGRDGEVDPRASHRKVNRLMCAPTGDSSGKITASWSDLRIEELNICKKTLSRVGSSPTVWSETRSSIHRLKGALLLAGDSRDVTLAKEVNSLLMCRPGSWQDKRYAAFMGMIESVM